MIARSVSCVVGALAEAEHIVERLKAAGFSRNDISILLPAKTNLAPGCGTLDWLGGLAVFPIPGVEPLLAAGPIVASSLGANGRVVKNMAEALAILGVFGADAQSYEEALRAGNTWFSVVSSDSDVANRAQWIFNSAGAKQISLTRESRILEPLKLDPSTVSPPSNRQRRKRFGRLFSS